MTPPLKRTVLAAFLLAGVLGALPASAQTTQSQTVQTSGTPTMAIPEFWFGAGVTANMWYSSVFATTDTTKPTIGGQITVDHAVGGNDPYNVFGMAWFDAVVGREAGGNVYGRNTVCMADAGFRRLMTCYEFNNNNFSGADAGPPNSSNAQYGVVFATGGPHKITAYSWMIGTQGVAGSRYGTVFDVNSVSDIDIFDNNSGANTLMAAIGPHQYGLQFHNASFASAWATVPNNSPLQALGANKIDLHPLISLSPSDRIELGDAAHDVNVPGNLQLKGSIFPATPSAWSPTLTCAGGGTPTYNIQGGSHIITGNLVQVWFYLALSGTGGCSGALTITGLPAVSGGAIGDRGYVGLTNYQGINAGPGQTQLSGFVTPGSTSAPLISTSATGSPAVSLTGAMLTTSVVLQGLITYHK